ncbi:MAG: single-stranded DNA-binding protein [Lachnospiraceae bacterium]|nr:single-stranded DNA-binding protein [Lachnospiraceae bacterium]
MNKVVVKGRLTSDPKIAYGNDSNLTCYARFTLAVEDRAWKVDENNFHVDYIPCLCVGKSAEIADKYTEKGKEILVFGKMQSGSYKNKEGKTIYSLQLKVEEIEFCGKKQEDTKKKEKDFFDIPDDFFDDLPFK